MGHKWKTKLKLFIPVLSLFGMIFSPFVFIQPVFAGPTDCQVSTEVKGLISAQTISGKLGNLNQTCVLDPKAAYAKFQVKSYDDLKSLFYNQSKISTKLTQLPSPLRFNGDGLYWLNPAGGANVSIGATAIDPTGTGIQVIFVETNLILTKPIVYHTNDSAGGIIFIVKGNIYIDKDMATVAQPAPNPAAAQIDAVLISQGQICTNTDLTQVPPICLTPNDAASYGKTTQLVVNGSLVSLNKTAVGTSPIVLGRNLGGLALVPDANNPRPAELISEQVKYLVILKNLFTETQSITTENTNYASHLNLTPTTTPPPGVQPIVANLLAYWKMDENGGTFARNVLGTNNLDLTLGSNSTFVKGRLIRAISNPGTSPGATVSYTSGNPVDFTQATRNKMSVSFWLKISSALSDTHVIEASGIGGWGIEYTSAGQMKLVTVGRNSIAWDNVVSADNSWNHYVITYDGSGSQRAVLYKNNTQVGSKPFVSSWTTGNRLLSVGGDNSNPLKGIIDEVGIWSAILTPTDVTALYHNGSGATYCQ